MTRLLIRLFSGRSTNFKDPAVRVRCGYLGSATGITLNVLLFMGKFIAGLLSGAISVTADAFNNLSDAGSSIMSLAGFKIAAQPADKEHPYGHGRMEYVSGLVISFVIMLMGFELAKSSFDKIFKPEEMTFSYLTLGILIASVLVKLWMGLFYRKLGNLINSASLKAACADSISDCAATSAVIAAMLIFRFAGVNIDGYIGAAVALFIIYSGISTFRSSLTPILGAKPDMDFVEEIRQKTADYPGVLGVHDILVHDYGVGNLMVSMHAEIPSDMSLVAAHDLIDRIETELKDKYNCLVTIHMDPVEVNDEKTFKTKEFMEKTAAGIDPRITIHDFRITKCESGTVLVFDVLVPYELEMTEDEVIKALEQKALERDENCSCRITVDTDYA